MNNHYDLDEIPCPRCGGDGGWWDSWADDEHQDWHICSRCHGAGTILVKIEKEKDAK